MNHISKSCLIILIIFLLNIFIIRCNKMPSELNGTPPADCDAPTNTSLKIETYNEVIIILEVYDYEKNIINFNEYITTVIPDDLLDKLEEVNVTWPGQDSNGNNVTTGLYLIKITLVSSIDTAYRCEEYLIE